MDQNRIGWHRANRPARLRVVADAYGLDRDGRNDLLTAMDDAIDRIEAAARRNAIGAGEQAAELLAATGGIEKCERRRKWWTRHHDEFVLALR